MKFNSFPFLLVLLHASLLLSSLSSSAILIRGGSSLPSSPSTSNSQRSPLLNRISTSPTRPTTITIPTKRSRGILKGTVFNDSPKSPSPQQNSLSATSNVNSLLTHQSRRHFIAKVYTILSVQLLVTGLSIAYFQTNKSSAISILSSHSAPIIQGLSTLIGVVSFYALMLSESLRRGRYKWLLLTAFTVSESFLVGLVTAFYPGKMVTQAVLATAVASACVSGYVVKNKNPKYDLTFLGNFLFAFSSTFLLYSLASHFHLLPFTLPWNELLMCSVGAGLSAAYLGYHTKMIIGDSNNGGKNKSNNRNRNRRGMPVTLNGEDYIFGALCLYNDIINIFIYILRILGEKDRQGRD